jgi:hypothetical protein
MPLYTLHGRHLATLFAEIETYALGQREVFVGTAGSVVQRTNASGFPFYAHQYYDGDGQRRETYLAGPVGSPDADSAAENLRIRIRELKGLVPSLRLLGREGFQLVDSAAYATLASLHNHGLFAAGAVLIGSHAYGVVLNRLGVRAAGYATEDIDIARRAALSFDRKPEKSLLDMLRDSGITFVEVPSLNRRAPSTSFKKRGRSTFQVDLLVPSRNETIQTIAVPELNAHAIGLPYLGYLLAETQTGALLAREGCCTVRVPLPERFAVHKLIVSMLRPGREAKALKDRLQAATLLAALWELHPGAVESAMDAVPKRAVRHLRRARATIRDVLETQHPRAWEELQASLP